MIRIALIVLGVLVGLVALTAAIGTALPRRHIAASEIVLPMAPDTVWTVVRNPAALVGTWPELTSAVRVKEASQREVWEEEVDGFKMRYLITDPAPWRMITIILAEPDAAFGGQWDYRVIPESQGTRVRVTESGWVGNPMFRVMMRIMGTHRALDGYLTALGRHFGQDVTPVHVRVRAG
ncbi:MAG: SRPBCC family protein [Gemmatimonadota bacterium]